MHVQIGCNTLYEGGPLRSAEEFDLSHLFCSLEIIAEAGFDAVEYSHAAHLNGDELSRLARRTEALGLVPWSFHAWEPLADEPSRIATVTERYRRTASIAQALGVSVVVVHSGGSMEQGKLEERRRANRETLSALAEMLGPSCTAAVENMSSYEEWAFLLEMIEGCRPPNIGCNIDVGHANLGNLGPVRAVEMAGGRIVTTHLQDNFGHRDDHLPPGEGKIEWESVLEAFRTSGYRGVYMVELSDCPPGRIPDVAEETRTAARRLKAWLQADEGNRGSDR